MGSIPTTSTNTKKPPKGGFFVCGQCRGSEASFFSAIVNIETHIIDLTALVLFCVFLWLAIKAARRRDIPLHLRLMAYTAILPLEAALERTYLNGTVTLAASSSVGLYVVTLLTTDVIAGTEWFQSLSISYANL